MQTEIISLCLASYLIGSIPFGVVMARVQNLNIREHGSGNIGATNVARVMGKKAGLLTLFGRCAERSHRRFWCLIAL